MSSARRALIIGCHGGVGRAVLSLLEKSKPGQQLRERFDEVLLVDAGEPVAPVPLSNATLLPPTAVTSSDILERLVREHAITQVVDLSSIDTVDCTRTCDELGADFLCTSVEEWPGQASIPTDDAIARLLPPRRPALGNRSHLVGSGANPGIVNALVFSALKEFAARTGKQATPEALDLHSVLITEEDTTVENGPPPPADVFAMTWSPAHCLEELYEPRAFAARNGKVFGLDHAPTEHWYRARCGEEIIEGMAVPHEEIATLARRLPRVEIGFIYRIPEVSRAALARHPDWAPQAWQTRRMWPPWTENISGEDRVGVLLCSERYGELWMGFKTDVKTGLAYNTNATQLQVASGAIAGWSQLGARTGIHFVEDLNTQEFVDVVSEILGPPFVVHDPDAPPLSLEERAVSETSVAHR